MPDPDIACIACSIFRSELQLLASRGMIPFPVHFIDSSLHLRTDLLGIVLRKKASVVLSKHSGLVLLYGDCHILMRKLLEDPRVVRPEGINCSEMLLGKTRYRQLASRGAFFVFPEWAARWRSILRAVDTTNPDLGRQIIHDFHSTLCFLDTGAGPIPRPELDAFSMSVGLPVEIEPVSLDHFASLIRKAVEQVSRVENLT